VNGPSALVGRRIVVTRSVDQAAPLAEMLRARGAEPIVLPLVEVIDVAEGVESLRTLDPAAFDWLVVTSPNAAEAYCSLHDVAPPAVAAVGTTTRAALSARGIDVAVVPPQQRAASLLATLTAAADAATALVVQSADAAPDLVDGLRAAGWTVTAVGTHRAVPVRPSDDELARAQDADAVLFASGSAARAWALVYGEAVPPVVVAMGPQTAADARRAGLTVTAVASESSLDGLIEALERTLGAG
jgi:uroporphyrinogen-III synthase